MYKNSTSKVILWSVEPLFRITVVVSIVMIPAGIAICNNEYYSYIMGVEPYHPVFYWLFTITMTLFLLQQPFLWWKRVTYFAGLLAHAQEVVGTHLVVREISLVRAFVMREVATECVVNTVIPAFILWSGMYGAVSLALGQMGKGITTILIVLLLYFLLHLTVLKIPNLILLFLTEPESVRRAREQEFTEEDEDEYGYILRKLVFRRIRGKDANYQPVEAPYPRPFIPLVPFPTHNVQRGTSTWCSDAISTTMHNVKNALFNWID